MRIGSTTQIDRARPKRCDGRRRMCAHGPRSGSRSSGPGSNSWGQHKGGDAGGARRASARCPGVTTDVTRLREQFGDIDIYLFDQLLRGRITLGMRILDAGCGEGRNLVYLMREGFDVHGIDQSAQAVDAIGRRAVDLGCAGGRERFSVQPVERMSFDDAAFDVVISSAVLHFARDEVHWTAMVDEMWRVLAP